MGKGDAALLTGTSLASDTHILSFDAEHEYSSTDVAKMLEPVLDGRPEVVDGTRLFGPNTVFCGTDRGGASRPGKARYRDDLRFVAITCGSLRFLR